MRRKKDIRIGDGKVISWSPIGRRRYRSAVPIDDLIPDADWFWSALEGHCVSGCCGIDAFDLTPEGIQWAAGADISPPAGLSWRPEQRGDPVQLAQQLDETIKRVQERGPDIVSVTVFNQLFRTSVFIELITHIANVLRQADGQMVLTDPF